MFVSAATHARAVVKGHRIDSRVVNCSDAISYGDGCDGAILRLLVPRTNLPRSTGKGVPKRASRTIQKLLRLSGKQARSQRHFGATATLRKKKLDAKDVLLRTRATVIVAANVDEFNDIVSKRPRRSLRWGKALQSRARSFAYAPLSQRNEVTSAAVNRTSHELALGHAADLPLGVELRRPQQLTRG